MTLFICWIIFPLVLCALCAGCGALLERAVGFRLAGALLVPAGLATMIVIATILTAADLTAELAAPAVVVAAIAGLALGRPWRGRTVDGWAVGAAVAVFAAFAAPVVLSGDATFAGYVKLDDSATWFALTDRVMEYGTTVSGLAPSSYEATLSSYLVDSGYPIGAFLPLGIGHAIVRQDLAWIFQPYLAFLAATLSLGLYSLVTKAVASRPVRALTVFVAAQPALLFGYGLWGGVKELAAVALMPLIAILAARATQSGEISIRRLVGLAVACTAMVSVVSVGALVWLGPILAGALVVLAWKQQWGSILKGVLALAGLVALLSLPLMLDGSLSVPTEVLTNQKELGNLAGPLDKLQVIGIWPNGDFRYRPDDFDLTRLMLVVAALSALGGLAWIVYRRLTGPLLFLLAAAAGSIAINLEGSPWADGKALATASPALLLFAMLGAAAVFKRQRAAGVILAVAIASGVLWSNVLAYEKVNLAPRDQLTELERIGNDYAGDGPTLMTEYNPYGVRHFLRRLDPEGASELRRRIVPLRGGGELGKGDSADIDSFDLSGVLTYRTLVLRNSPLMSRPPLPYELVRRGRYFDVWQRPVSAGPTVIEHLALGSDLDPGSIANCDQVEALARKLPVGGYLVTAPAPPVINLWVSRMARPQSWIAVPNSLGAVFPATSGTASGTTSVPARGIYSFWIGGGFKGKLTVVADGQRVATQRGKLNNPDVPLPLGDLYLLAGTQNIVLNYEVGGAYPGSKGLPFAMGPLLLSPRRRDADVSFVTKAKARTLCGKRFDWIEAVKAR